MSIIYFDITDITQFARRSTTLTGIQRVEFNLINLLVRKHGGNSIRCVFFHPLRQVYLEFDPAERLDDDEFNAERLLSDLGLTRHSERFPSRVRIKGYLRANARNKWQRIWMKSWIYAMAWFSPARLDALGLAPVPMKGRQVAVALRTMGQLPAGAHLVHLGSSWFFPETWEFAALHKARGGDVVQFIHDLIPVTHPQFMPAKEPPIFVNWLERALDYATRFPCNSQWTAEDLQRFIAARRDPSGLHVVPLAHEFIGAVRNSDPAVPERVLDLPSRGYVLCVGTIEARKNGLSLLQAWRQLYSELGNALPLLVFAGRFGKIGGEAVRQYIERHPDLTARVRVVDGPSDQVMAWLYRNCLFSTYPSHVEGWGLPVGESAWFGRYCVASHASSIPEVCGDLAGYVDPNDVASIKAGLRLPLTDSGYLLEKEAAIASAKLRTWQDVADELYDFIYGW